MVFFTCSHCGESVKKAAVAKHYQTKCKNQTPFLTCVDCLKDFKENDYEAHTKCFTEEEKYSAKGFVPKASANKGERKQKVWSECVQTFASNGDLAEDEKTLLEAISKHDNIPRKKAKFINFLSSTAKQFKTNTDLIDRVWTKLENYFKEVNSEAQKNSEENAVNKKNEETGTNQKEKKKRTQEEMGDEDEKNNDGEKSKKKKKNHSGEEPENGEEAQKIGKKKQKKRSCVNDGEEVNGKDEPKSKKAKNSAENGEANNKENVNQKKKKKKTDEKEDSNQEDAAKDEDKADDTFDWNDTITKIVTQNGAKNQIKVNKLQKKVLKLYGEAKGCEVDDKIAEKFIKKLNKIDSVIVNGGYVTLKS